MRKEEQIVSVLMLICSFLSSRFAPEIAGFLMGWKYSELSGSALEMKCLAELGGGSIAEGGYGLAGGKFLIISVSVLFVSIIGIAAIIAKDKTAKVVKINN